MKIAICASNMFGGGGLVVARAITSVLPQVAPMHEYRIAVPAGCGYEQFADQDNVQVFERPLEGYRKRILWEHAFIQEVNAWKCDWIWYIGNLAYSFPNCRKSLLVHSSYSMGYRRRHFGEGSLMKYFTCFLPRNLFIRRTARKCDTVYSQTSVTRDRIHKYFGIPMERLGLCPGNVSFDQHQQTDVIPEAARIMSRDKHPYKMIYVSIAALHKNYHRIVDMFDKYRNELKDVVCFFTFDEKTSPIAAHLVQKVKRRNLTEHIVFLGSISHQQISHCYREADVCFFPSLLETVGLGQLEAMYYGLPVIASDLDFGHAVCGNAAHYVDPFSLKSMKNGILAVKNHTDYAQNLVANGHRQVRANTKSWQDIVRGVLDFEKIEHL